MSNNICIIKMTNWQWEKIKKKTRAKIRKLIKDRKYKRVKAYMV